MPTEPTTAIINWSGLEGTLLDGGYEVEQCFATTDRSASFHLRILGDRFTKASVRFFATGGVSSQQFAIWTDACQLPQASLSKPIGVGQKELGGELFDYVMFAQADETVADVLRQRALVPEEVREILRNAVDALGALHSRGYVHACLSPKTILAVGNSVLLSTLGLRRINNPTPERAEAEYLAPESVQENLTPEADIWCLGATLFQALTQREFAEGQTGEFSALPSPFHAVTQRCLDNDPHARCSLSAIRAMLRGEQLELIAQPKPVVPTPAASAPLTKAAAAGASAGTDKSSELASDSLDLSADPLALDNGSGHNAAAKSSVTGADFSGSKIAGDAAGSPASPGRPASVGTGSEKKTAPTTSASISATTAGFPNTPNVPPKGPVRALPRQSRPRPDRSRPRSVVPPRPAPVAWQQTETFVSQSAGEYRVASAARSSSTSQILSYVALALGLIAGVFWLVWPKPAHMLRNSPIARDQSATGQTTGQEWPARELDPNAANAPAMGSSTASVPVPPTPSAPVPGSNWRVIAYTSTHEVDAQRRAEQITLKHPGFSPEVFSPAGHGSPYLVVLGGLMTRDQAIKVRRRAKSAGLARDVYIQNYSH